MLPAPATRVLGGAPERRSADHGQGRLGRGRQPSHQRPGRVRHRRRGRVPLAAGGRRSGAAGARHALQVGAGPQLLPLFRAAPSWHRPPPPSIDPPPSRDCRQSAAHAVAAILGSSDAYDYLPFFYSRAALQSGGDGGVGAAAGSDDGTAFRPALAECTHDGMEPYRVPRTQRGTCSP